MFYHKDCHNPVRFEVEIKGLYALTNPKVSGNGELTMLVRGLEASNIQLNVIDALYCPECKKSFEKKDIAISCPYSGKFDTIDNFKIVVLESKTEGTKLPSKIVHVEYIKKYISSFTDRYNVTLKSVDLVVKKGM